MMRNGTGILNSSLDNRMVIIKVLICSLESTLNHFNVKVRIIGLETMDDAVDSST